MDVYREELRLVTEELVYIRDQVRDLLDRQTTLQGKKSELEAILKQSTAKPRHGDEQQFDRTDFAWSGDLEAKLTSVFGIRALRPLQLRTMNVTLSGKDCMLIMPTGGGKSLCFQLPALLSKGVTLVVSPLISLMEDQLMALKALGVPAAMLSASATLAEVKQVQEDMLDNNAELKVLYVTPEKLAKSKRFMAKLEKMYELGRFARLVIDEVHCCSQWGHDFRPDYKFLGIMKRQFPEVPILGLTATATISVLRDVQTILNLPAESSYLFRSSFNRANLYYEVRHKPATSEKVLEEIVGLLKTDFKGQSGIIYCFSKKEAEELHLELTKKRIESGCYHADCTAKDRSKTHQMWTANKLQVMVATVAFGMGIDKPDVRFVIHHSISKSMENLYQESGRAGRDDQPSRCIVYYRLADVFRQSSMVFTEQTGLDNLMGLVEYCTDTHRCRRSMIARHFGEVWESSHCNGMCDHCDPMKKVVADTIDVTRLCSAVITILDHAADQTQRITANMLIDTWQGKGKKPMKDSGAPVTSLSREECELVIAVMLQQAYVREDFHFTPYSTISYLVPGTKAVTLRHHSASVHIKVSPQTFSCLPRVDPADVVLQKEKPKTTAHFSSSVHIDLTGNKVDVKLEDTRKPAKKGDDKSVKNREEKSVKKAEEKATKKGAKSEEKSSLKRGGGDRPEVNHLDFCDYLAGSPPQTPTLVEGKSPAKKRKS